MSELLLDLWQLAQCTSKTPKEDFLTGCLGHYLKASEPFADRLVEALAISAESIDGGTPARALRSWRDASPESRSLDVECQYPTADPGGQWGWVDILLDLRENPNARRTRVIIEAKVGSAAPSAKQVEPYRIATGADLVVALVREGVTVHLKGVAQLTWDQVWETATGATGAGGFADLLAASGEVSTWFTVTPEVFLAARQVAQTDGALVRSLARELLPWLFSVPDQVLWKRVSQYTARELAADSPSHGEGAGFSTGKVLGGTYVFGATLALVPQRGGKALVWRLEVLPTIEGRARLLQQKRGRWEVVRHAPKWLATDLPLPVSGFAETDLVALVKVGRAALAQVYKGHHLGPFAPSKLTLPTLAHLSPGRLATGIARAGKVNSILRLALLRAAELGAHGMAHEVRPHRDRVNVKAGQRRVRLSFDAAFTRVSLEDRAGRNTVKSRWTERVKDIMGATLEENTSTVTLPLDEHTWKDGRAFETLIAAFVTDGLQT